MLAGLGKALDQIALTAVLNVEGCFTSTNEMLFEALGFSAGEVQGKRFDQFLAPDFPKSQSEVILQNLRNRNLWKGELHFRNKKAGSLWLDVSIIPASGQDNIFYFVGFDVTERKEREKLVLEQQAKLVASSKLSSLGEMAAGIAHEINNPLAIIGGRAAQIQSRIRAGRVETEWLVNVAEGIEDTVFRIAKIIRSMQKMSREADRDAFEAASICEIINEVLIICGARFAVSNTALELDTLAQDIQLVCRPVQICQLLVNLLNNSYDAVCEQSPAWVRLSFHEHSDFVEMWVTDSGSGIAPNLREKLFQPFFTTKPVGSGIGLGLSTSRAIARAHGGDLNLDIHCPNTRFVLRLSKHQTAAGLV